MLDNFSLEMMREAVKINAGRAALENSGNITLDNLKECAETWCGLHLGRCTNQTPQSP